MEVDHCQQRSEVDLALDSSQPDLRNDMLLTMSETSLWICTHKRETLSLDKDGWGRRDAVGTRDLGSVP